MIKKIHLKIVFFVTQLSYQNRQNDSVIDNRKIIDEKSYDEFSSRTLSSLGFEDLGSE